MQPGDQSGCAVEIRFAINHIVCDGRIEHRFEDAQRPKINSSDENRDQRADAHPNQLSKKDAEISLNDPDQPQSQHDGGFHHVVVSAEQKAYRKSQPDDQAIPKVIGGFCEPQKKNQGEEVKRKRKFFGVVSALQCEIKAVCPD